MQLSDLEKIDKKRMFETYDKWPEIAKECYKKNYDLIEFSEIEHIVFVGMGGSGTISNFFSSILSKTNVHVSVVKGYTLPKTVDSNSLIVATSISGNTDETLSVLKNSNKLGCKVVAFSSGGLMEDYCYRNNIHHSNIPKYHSPRASFISYSYSMLNALSEILPVNKSDVEESLKLLKKTGTSITSNNLSETNIALDLAEWINTIPIIYYPIGLQTAAIRLKNSLQENSKMHVIAEEVLEASHNGIVGWENPLTANPIFIRGINDHIKTKERWEILEEYFKEQNIGYKEIFSVDGNIISKLMCLIFTLDYASIYKAILMGIDPTPVKSIDFIKQKLNSNNI